MVTPANVTDRDAAREVLPRPRLEHPEITQVWADQAYSGELVTWAKDTVALMLRISKKPPARPASRSCLGAGSSSVPCSGSPRPAAWSATTNASHATPKPWSTGPPSP